MRQGCSCNHRSRNWSMVRGGQRPRRTRTPVFSCQPGPWKILGQRIPRKYRCFRGNSLWSLGKGRLWHQRRRVQAERSAWSDGATEEGGVRSQAPPEFRVPGGAAAGSQTRTRVRHQPQVPREQAQEVEDDGGFVAPRRVLQPGKEAERG